MRAHQPGQDASRHAAKTLFQASKAAPCCKVRGAGGATSLHQNSPNTTPTGARGAISGAGAPPWTWRGIISLAGTARGYLACAICQKAPAG